MAMAMAMAMAGPEVEVGDIFRVGTRGKVFMA